MFFETLVQDIRIGLRVLAKEKGFCALAIFVLALGICGVTTMFAVVNGVLLRGFNFPQAEELVDVQMVDPANFSPTNFNSRMTTADFAELKAQVTSFAAFAGYLNGSTINMTHNGVAQRLTGGYVTHDFFRTLGVKPVLGRDFLPEEDKPGVNKAVLLTDALWRREFGADPGVLNRQIRINGRSASIIGVMPPKFSFPGNEELWVPVNTEFPPRPRTDRGINFISVIARLKPGVSHETASAEVSTYARQFAAAFPETNQQFTQGWVRPLIQVFTGGQLSQLLYTMLAFCLGVLLIACVNVMNMQFGRATLRTKELAIRSSLGASRLRLVRQMLTESLLLAFLGAVIGVALALWSTDLLQQATTNLANPIPSWMRFKVDAGVLALVAVATGLSAVISGFVPAWLASRTSAVEVLKESGRGNTGRSMGIITRGLVIFQIVVTSILLIGALLQTQSILNQQKIDYGYDTTAMTGARVGLMEGDYPNSESRRLFYEKLLRELQASPELEAVALTNRFRMVFSGQSPVEIEGKVYAQDSDRTVAQMENISPGYSEVLRQRLLDGRDFTESDSDQKLPVAIVNTTFARKHFGTESPIGRRFRSTQQNGTAPGPWRQIVGVVSDVRMIGPFNNQSDNAGYYVPFFAAAAGPAAEAALAPQFATILARAKGATRGEAAAQAVRAVIRKVDPNLPAYFVETPKISLDRFIAQNRIIATMFAVFGGVAIVLAATGLYGVMSFSVNQRTQEFGIRMALGADTRSILTMVMKQGTWQLTLGLFVGLGISLLFALLAEQGIQNFLFEIRPSDPLTYVSVALLLGFVATLASLVPALRATQVDPMVALHAD
ncbi:MAG: ABC transporter permease [Opitutaceae bacterium]